MSTSREANAAGPSRYHVWVVLDVERWSHRPEATGARVQIALERIHNEALWAIGVAPAQTDPQRTGDGRSLLIPVDVPKERLTDQFVDALGGALDEYNLDCPDGEQIRLRVALNAGESVDGQGEWSSRALTVAHRLINSEVVRRVLDAASGCSLVVAVPASWYDAVVSEGHASAVGWAPARVIEKDYQATAYLKVPGRRNPPGLQFEDRADPAETRREQASPTPVSDDGYSDTAHHPGNSSTSIDNSITHGDRISIDTVQRDVIFGHRYSNRREPGGER